MSKPKRGSLSEQAYIWIKNAIMNHHLKAGELYSATDLGKRVGVSRTPIREAAQQLEKIGMVRVEKNRGIRILSTSFDELIDAFEVRLLLEVPMMRHLAMKREESDCKLIQASFDQFHKAALSDDPRKTMEADRDYHLTLLTLAGNQRVIKIIEQTRNSVLFSGPSTVPHSRSCMEAFEDHRLLHEAVLGGDPTTAMNAMQQHLLSTARQLITQEAKMREEWDIDELFERLAWLKLESQVIPHQ